MHATCAAPGLRDEGPTSTRHACRQRLRTPRQNSAAHPPECCVCLGSTAPPAAAEALPVQHAWRLHAVLPSPWRASAAAAACVQSPRPVIRPRCQCNVAGRLLAVPCRPRASPRCRIVPSHQGSAAGLHDAVCLAAAARAAGLVAAISSKSCSWRPGARLAGPSAPRPPRRSRP